MYIPVLTPWLEKRQRSSGVGSDAQQWLIDALGGVPGKAGITVNNTTAMRMVTVYACVRIISESMASLPLKVYQRTGTDRGKKEAPTHPLYRLLHDAPNADMTAMQLRETLQAHILTWGNGYAYIVRDQMGSPAEIYPLMPNVTRCERTPGGTELVYITRLPTGEERRLRPESVLHIRGLGWDGLTGYSPIHMAREAIGMGLAAEEFGARMYAQGTHLGGVVQHPEALSDEAYRRLKTSMTEQYQGLGKSHLLLILEEGAKFEKIGIPPNEAQWLDARRFQMQEISRLYRVPPHMLADLERATHTNIEHQGLEFVTQTLRPWLVRWEQAIQQRLLGDGNYFAEHVVEGLLRGDIQSRYNAYSIGRQNGWLSADEIRALENMNPLPDGHGEEYWQPLNMGVVGQEPPPPAIGPEADDERTLPRVERRSARSRSRLAARHEHLFADAYARIVNAEARDVERKARQELKSDRSHPGMDLWLEQYYRDAPEWMVKRLLPAALTLGGAIQEEVAREVGAPVGVSTALEQVIRERTHAEAMYHSVSSRNQLQRVITDAAGAGEDPFEAVRDRLDSWQETRPSVDAKRATVKEANAIAEHEYRDKGYTRKIWVTLGADPCEYCQALDGMTVSIGGYFGREGETFRPEGAEPMQISGNLRYPPLHRGCVCEIEPG